MKAAIVIPKGWIRLRHGTLVKVGDRCLDFNGKVGFLSWDDQAALDCFDFHVGDVDSHYWIRRTKRIKS